MSAIDDLDFLDAFDDDEGYERPKRVKCRNCGDECEWDYTWRCGERKWFLVEIDDGKPHTCGARPARADEFPLEPSNEKG